MGTTTPPKQRTAFRHTAFRVNRFRSLINVPAMFLLAAGLFHGGPAVATTINETLKVTASDAASGDNFGFTVGLSGTTAVVAARLDDDPHIDMGSAYVYDVTSGSQLFKLTATDAAADDTFGHSLAIDGQTVLVGAVGNDDNGSFSGSAYIFDATSGIQQFKLTASDAAAQDGFGFSAGVAGNTAIVGAPSNDDAGGDSGSAYLFNALTGSETFKLIASDAAAGDVFGYSAAVSGNTAIVGAQRNDDAGTDSGSAYLFDTLTGNEQFKLTASDAAANDNFGFSVAVSGTTAIVGAPDDDDAGSQSGSAYLFDTLSGNELFKLTASDASANDRFGYAVAISGNLAVVGAYLDDDAGVNSGAAYVFDVTTGNELLKLIASDGTNTDLLGFSAAVSGNSALMGALFDDDDGTNSGSAYVFTIPEPGVATLLITALVAAVRVRGSQLS